MVLAALRYHAKTEREMRSPETDFEPQGLDASRCENCHMTSDMDNCYTSRFVRFIQSFMDMYALSRTANSLDIQKHATCTCTVTDINNLQNV